jgi:hypothetical protein
MTSRTDDIVKGLMAELAHEDQVLVEAGDALQQAEVRFEVASQKYAAVRDVVATYLGRPPCNSDAVHYGVFFRSNDRYRFIHMTPGDAIVAALRDSDEPMALHEIANALMGGGLRVPDMMRAVNAALMKTGGIEKTEDGKYRYVEPEDEELPFK